PRSSRRPPGATQGPRARQAAADRCAAHDPQVAQGRRRDAASGRARTHQTLLPPDLDVPPGGPESQVRAGGVWRTGLLAGLDAVPQSDTPPAARGAAALAALRERAVATLVELSPVAVELGELFAAAGFELALVGGPVRDAFLGKASTDLDFATSARPDDTARLLERWGEATWDIGR